MFIQVCGDIDVKHQRDSKRGIPQRADDGPAVVAGVDLELVGVGEAEDLAVSQPEHIRWILVLGAGASEIALHGDGFAQG